MALTAQTQNNMQEKLESLLKHNRMAGEMSMAERLMRQKNVILQRQLDVNLQILDKEERTSQKQLEHLVEEYSEFLRDIPSKWADLDAYIQPDTRAMRNKTYMKVKKPSDQLPAERVRSPSPHRPHTATSRQSTVATPITQRNRPRSSPQRQMPKFNTCIEVLDDIIQNHSLRKKPDRQRKIGLVMPTPMRSEDTQAPTHTTAHSDGHKVDSVHPVRIRPFSSYITTPTTTSTDVQKRLRPQTAHQLRISVRAASPRSHTPGTEDPRLPRSSAARAKRPKTAPPKYELYARSPAIPKRTVAGIMAEMHSRRAATREMLGKSKQLQKYITNLAWVDI